MTYSAKKLRKTVPLLVLCPLLLFLGSCRSAMMNPVQNVSLNPLSRALSTGRAMLVDPFLGPDHVQLSKSYAVMTAMNHRVRPSTTITQRRPLTLADCRRLALVNTLELQQARIEEMTQKMIEYSNRTKLLPHVIFSGELSERDNYMYSFSELLGQEGVQPRIPQDIGAGTGVNNYSTGRERSTWRYVLETRWSPTDAALAYYLTRSSRNDKRKQHYIRIRIAQRLIGVVDSAFQRLLTLQRVIPMAERLVRDRQRVARKMENLLESKLVPVEDYHKLKRKVIKARRLLSSMRNEAEQQRNLLASSIYASPEYQVDGGFYLVGELTEPTFNAQVPDMELTAVKHRPEAYRAGLEHLNSVNDLKRTIVKYFPKVTGFWRYTRDKDKHLLNKDWKEVGMLVYFDLLEWSVNLWESKATKWITSKTQREIGAVALGITTQVRSAALKYYNAMDELRSAKASLVSTRKVLRVQRNRTDRDGQDRLALEEAEGDVLQERIEKLRATGEAQGQLAELHSAMGTNYNEAHVY
jgi:outer membrane protein TolC